VVPQGNLAERMRAAGAGIGAFFCPTGVGTPLAVGKETREIDGREYVLEYPIKGDVALVGAHVADRMGNLVYRKTARNFNPMMATAGKACVAEVEEIVPTGSLDPDHIHTPGIYVDRIAQTVPFVPPVPQELTDELVLGTLRRLPATFQDVILLCDVEDLSYKEAAEALAIPIGTVMSRLHRGRARLRLELAAADAVLVGQSTVDGVNTLHERIEAS